MNTSRFIPVLLIGLTVAGCATLPLKNDRHRQRLAESIDSEPSAITFMNYCFFEEIEAPSDENQLTGVRGIVAMTESEICIMDGVLRNAPKNYFLKIPFSDIEGVNNSGKQVLIKYQDRMIALFLYDWADFVSDPELNLELYQSLVFADVPTFETEERYRFSRLRTPDYPSLNPIGEAFPNSESESIQSILAREAARDREIERMHGR